MNNRIYWEQREKLKLDNSLKDVDKLEKLLEKEYKKASKEIEKEIALLFNRYATENKLTFAEASKYLSSNEFKEWRYDLKTYVKMIESNSNEVLLLELNTLSMKSRITRLEEMYYQIDKHINSLYNIQESETTELLTDTIKNSYYQTIYDTHKFIGVGSSFALVDDKLVRDTLSYPWSGQNYSERIWSNRTKLKNVVRQEITQMVVRGETSNKISKRVAEKMDSSLYNARRLINTEHSYVMSEATCKAFEELDIEKYEFLATLDNRTSVICQNLDGKVFNLKDRVVGVNASPCHCFCRSTELPVIDDDYIGTRTARDKNNKTIEVLSDMTYNQWHDEFIKGVKSDYKPREKKKPIIKDDIAKNKDGEAIVFDLQKMKEDKKQSVIETITELSSKYNTRLRKVTNEAGGKGTKGSVDMAFTMNLSSVNKSTIVHEFAHSLTMTSTEKLGITNDKEFWKEIKAINKEYKKAITKDFSKQISQYSLENVGEFMAEAFAHSYLKGTKHLGWEFGNDFEYSDKVMKVIDKYFSKRKL